MTYTWDNAMDEGRRRLALLERSLDPGTFRRLETIGVAEGWRCLDVGAGGGTVCEWLARRVGAAGRVCAVDLDTRFVRVLNYPQLEVREEDILTTDLPDASFDLVHTRWTLMHIAERDRVLRKLIELLKPGGTLFLEESDRNPIDTLDRTAWRDVSQRVFQIIALRGSKVDWARDLPYIVSQLGLQRVRAEAEHPYFFGGSDLAEFWKISWKRVRDGVAASGADVAEWDRELAELDDPTRLFVGPMTVSVIANKSR
jgi:ubiquinone/menaquinone biosynthesis C-methylase UbiE